VLEYTGKVVKYNSSIPKLSLPALVELQMTLNKSNSHAKKVSTLRPFENIEFATKMDMMNLEKFLYSGLSFSSSQRSIIDAAIKTIYGFEPSQLNTLFALMYIKSAGSFEALALCNEGCAQEKKVKGGTQQISEKMLKSVLENESNRILFNTALVAIKQPENDGGELTEVIARSTLDDQRLSFKCKKVISSMPIHFYTNIDFTPRLPFYKLDAFKG
jgi:monoamine oxidase